MTTRREEENEKVKAEIDDFAASMKRYIDRTESLLVFHERQSASLAQEVDRLQKEKERDSPVLQ